MMKLLRVNSSLFSGRGLAQACCRLQQLQASTSSTINQSPAMKEDVVEEHIPVMPHCDFQPEPFEGMDYETALQLRKEHVTPGIFNCYRKPLYLHQGHQQWLFDTDGNRYLDFFGGICTVGVGHCHPKVQDALQKQLNKLWHTTNIYMHEPLQKYAQKLTSKLPEHLSVAYFVNSGTEANEVATLLARLHTGNWDIIVHRNSYHGAGPYTIGMLSHSNWKYNFPTGFGMHASMNPDSYKGLFGDATNCRGSSLQFDPQGAEHASDFYISQLQEMFDYNLPPKIAAFFAEPIQGVGGIVEYPKGYLQKAYEKVRQHGGICVSDEVQTGFGRLGSHFWGFEYAEVSPDIVTMAKSIANGFPMAAVVTTKEIAAKHAEAVTMNTFGGNPMACAAAQATLEVMEDEELQANCAKVGAHFAEGMKKIQKSSSIIGDVRGMGLMQGVEMVTDKTSKKPLPADTVMDIWEATRDMGVLFGKGGRFGNVFRVQPPMCVTIEDVDFALEVMSEAVKPYH